MKNSAQPENMHSTTQARRLPIGWGGSFPQLADHFGCVRSTHARGIWGCPPGNFLNFILSEVASGGLCDPNLQPYCIQHVAT